MSVNTSNGMITLASYPRAVVHLDADAFFASCEQAQNPALKGRPVVTGAERGIISSASYEAKALGIKRGVSLRDARRMCPGLVVMPSDYETYSIYSERMFAIIKRFTPAVEEFSIDEAFCDITGLRRLYRCSYEKIARTIKSEIKKELDITVSAGLSLTKTLAKICSRFEKPNGFTAVPGRSLHEFLKKVPVGMVCGFGPNSVELLAKNGITTVYGYVNRNEAFGSGLFGKIGRELWHELRGAPAYGINTEKKEKYLSVGKSKTFSPPSDDRAFVKAQLLRNLESACMKLRRHGLSAARIAVYLRTQDFRHTGLEAKLNRHSSSALDFTRICAEVLDAAFRSNTLYRATGIVFSDIAAEGADRVTLFDDPLKVSRLENLSRAMDAINAVYGKYAVHIASTGPAIKTTEETHPRNVTARRKLELLKGETFRRRVGIPLLKLR